MKKLTIILALVVVVLFTAQSVFAQTGTTSQNLSLEVKAIYKIGVSGDPAALIVQNATAGSGPDAATNATTTYSVTHLSSAVAKIVGTLDSNVPANTTLTVNLGAPAGATSAGALSLSTVGVQLVSNIANGSSSGNTIGYSFSATTGAAVGTATRVVTFTISN
jgi:hypothetical protein